MELLCIGGGAILAVIAVGAVWLWVKDQQERDRLYKAVKNVLEEHPQYVQTVTDYRVYARKLMRELNQETITFTYNIND